MNLDDYQKRAKDTDQNPEKAPPVVAGVKPEPSRSEIIPLLGMVGEVGSLLAEYKKLLRDGESHRRFKDEVAEELGDILWYVATVASKYDLSLDRIAEQNLEKVEARWKERGKRPALYDANQRSEAQLPREFAYSFEHTEVNGAQRLVLVDFLDGQRSQVGDSLSDNTYSDDGYRFHDIFHLTLAALFGWSPVHRKLLRKAQRLEHRSPSEIDDSEDGGRAQVLEEAIALSAYSYAAVHNMFANTDAVDWQLLKTIKRLTEDVEVKDRTPKEWNDAILRAFAIWRQLRDNNGGIVRGNLLVGSIEFTPPR